MRFNYGKVIYLGFYDELGVEVRLEFRWFGLYFLSVELMSKEGKAFVK